MRKSTDLDVTYTHPLSPNLKRKSAKIRAIDEEDINRMAFKYTFAGDYIALISSSRQDKETFAQ